MRGVVGVCVVVCEGGAWRRGWVECDIWRNGKYQEYDRGEFLCRCGNLSPALKVLIWSSNSKHASTSTHMHTRCVTGSQFSGGHSHFKGLQQDSLTEQHCLPAP